MNLHDTLKKNKNKKNVQIGVIVASGILVLVLISVIFAYISVIADQNKSNDSNTVTAIMNG